MVDTRRCECSRNGRTPRRAGQRRPRQPSRDAQTADVRSRQHRPPPETDPAEQLNISLHPHHEMCARARIQPDLTRLAGDFSPGRSAAAELCLLSRIQPGRQWVGHPGKTFGGRMTLLDIRGSVVPRGVSSGSPRGGFECSWRQGDGWVRRGGPIGARRGWTCGRCPPGGCRCPRSRGSRRRSWGRHWRGCGRGGFRRSSSKRLPPRAVRPR